MPEATRIKRKKAAERAASDRINANAKKCRDIRSGGARRDRTDDLLLAKQALSQLSYGPVRASDIRNHAPADT